MKRFKHNLGHYRLLSCDMGELIPLTWYEVLPGDTVQQRTSLLLRVSPMLSPVMHPVQVRVHHWYCPYRLLLPLSGSSTINQSKWEEFITGGEFGVPVVLPTLASGPGGFPAGGLMDYLGVPPTVINLVVSAFPARAYGLIWNEYYRDQELQILRQVGAQPGVDGITDTSLALVDWEKDYFTTSRPAPQRGPAITVPVLAKVENIRLHTQADAVDRNVQATAGTNVLSLDGAGLAATSPAQFGSTTGLQLTVADLREALALQKFAEARSRYGSRYTEYLRYLGVKSSDDRLQRPEYLGGGKQTIAFSEVLQTAEGVNPVGEMRGHGISAVRSRPFRRFFEEHGLVMSLLSVRPRSIYTESLHRSWSRLTREDYYQKELELIGQQEVFRREIFAQSDALGGNAVFGWQDRYEEYRSHPSSVAAEFRTATMNDWHLARSFAVAPTLNSSFVSCVPTKRIHAVQTQDVLWVMANHNIVARRMVGHGGSPGVR